MSVDESSSSAFILLSTITTIRANAFNGCSNLLKTTESTTIVSGKNIFIIPDSVTSIGASAFQSCTTMQVLYIPSTVAKIGINLVYGTSTNTLSIYCNITWNQYLSIKGNSGWYANWYSLASGIAKVYFYSSTQPTTSDNSLIPTYLAGYWYGASTGTISVYA